MKHEILDVDMHLFKRTEDGVPRSHTGTFYGDTVAAQGWSPLAAGELEPEWTVRGCESRAKLWAAEHPDEEVKPIPAKVLAKATAKKASKKR